jgi:hypothetical protein
VLVFLEEMMLLGLFLVQAVALAAVSMVCRQWALEHQTAKADLPATARLLHRKHSARELLLR